MRAPRWINPYIALVSTKPHYILQAVGGFLDQQQIFDLRQRMLDFDERYAEIGSGSGGHLLAQAERHPRGFFVGFELRYKRAYDSGRKAERNNINNVVVVRGQGSELFKVFEARSLTGIFVNFPDPWDKRRWHKHRMLNPAFLQAAHLLLKPKGFISYKTDHGAYFEETIKLFREMQLYTIEIETQDLYSSEHATKNIPTEFERLFLSKGLPIKYLLARKYGE